MSEPDALVTAWADDLYLHGVHLARWIVDYVDLEESLAVGTLAQEQLAHARELLTVAGLEPADVDRRLFDRPAADWAPSRLAADPIQRWPQVVGVGLILSHATLAMLAEADLAHGQDDGAVRVAGIISEQRLHLMHWQRWTVLLAGSRSTRDDFLDTLQWAGQLAADLFGALADGDSTAGAGPSWLRPAQERFATELAASLAEADIPVLSFDVSEPRRPGRHAEVVQPVLTDQQAVRPRYPDPVLEPR